MSQDDVERVARAIYEASPTVWVETREPTTMPSPAYEWVRRPIPWDELDTTVPQEAGAANEARIAARAALGAMPQRELLAEALEALDRIVDFHIGDCPMTMEEIDFAKNINWQIRKTARAAAGKIRAALTQEKS